MEVDDQELGQEFERLQRALGLAPGSRTVDRFRLVSQLGKGGMGIVYAAEDPELGRKLAVKLVRPRHRASRERLEARLQREARALARLSHPNVVHVYDVGTDGDQLWVAMELVDGPTLLDWQWQQQRTVDELIAVYLQAAAGLSAAHDAGFVHRDFKPENVFVTADGRVLVGDFGLASLDDSTLTTTDTGPHPSAGLTETGAVLGTLGYMAPEQLRGEDVDPRADQFGFCVALWEAIARERPFAGTTTDGLLAAIEARELHGAERVPRRLRAILQRGLAYQRDDRFADLRELVGAIQGLDRRRPWLRAGLGLAAIAIAIAVATVLAVRDAPEPCDERERIDRLWARDRDRVIEQLSPASVLEGRVDAAVQHLRARAEAVCREPGDERRVVLRRAIDELATALARPEALELEGWLALIASVESLDLDRPAIDPQVAAAIDRSRMHEWRGESEPAWQAADEAVRLALAAARGGWSASASEALIQRGRMHKNRRDFEAAHSDFVAGEAHAEGSGYGAHVLRARLEHANVLVKYVDDTHRSHAALVRLEPLLSRYTGPFDSDRAVVHELRSTLAMQHREFGPCFGHAIAASFIHGAIHPDPLALTRTYESFALSLEQFGVGDVEPLLQYSAAVLEDQLPQSHVRRLNLDYNRARLELESEDREQQMHGRATLQRIYQEGDSAIRMLAARALLYDAIRNDEVERMRALVDELRPEDPLDPHVIMAAARFGELDLVTLDQVRTQYLARQDLATLAGLEHAIAGSYGAAACDVAGVGLARVESIAPGAERENLRVAFERLLTSLDCL
ncbi:MAG TPA: serine/threonine-protein kinase [Enhygromyxa sp.]|nr:serine/threonine-protein kinase [Enhygromyxa sp.]